MVIQASVKGRYLRVYLTPTNVVATSNLLVYSALNVLSSLSQNVPMPRNAGSSLQSLNLPLSAWEFRRRVAVFMRIAFHASTMEGRRN
jgi:hypothetical protein